MTGAPAVHLPASTNRDDGKSLPLTDPKLERTALLTAIHHPSEVGTSFDPDDFSATHHRIVARALLELRQRGEAMDHNASFEVVSELRQNGRFDRLPDDLREDLGNGQDLGRVEMNVTALHDVADLARRRRRYESHLQAAKALVARKDRQEAEIVDALANDAEEERRAHEQPARRSLADRLRSMAPDGERLSTGFQTLDDATRGGIPLGKVVVAVGAPGAAKTTLTAYWAHEWERAGATVVYLAADEPADGVATRFAQLDGYVREDLEASGPIGDRTRASAAEAAEGRNILLLDGDDDDMTLEGAARALDDAAGQGRRVLVVDSVQTVSCEAAQSAETLREQMDARMVMLRRIARSGALVVAVSEMARSGYRGAGADASTLATGKESGSIEFKASLLLGLRSVKGEVGQVDVDVAKNRIGAGKPELRLRVDFDRASVSEIGAPAKDDAEPTTEEHRARGTGTDSVGPP